MKDIQSYRAVIFDVDGTLYHQSGLRATMARKLLLHVLLHPGRFRDLKIIKTFREFREQPDAVKSNLALGQYQVVADKMGLPAQEIQSVIEKWMYREPLPHIRKCCDEKLVSFVQQLRAWDIMTIAYSDYPAVEKLAAIGVQMDHVFSAADPLIDCLKPNPQGLRAILNQLALAPADCLLIGDRMEKDGRCAEQVGMDFIILPKGDAARVDIYGREPFLL